jgi:hypothetical protein
MKRLLVLIAAALSAGCTPADRTIHLTPRELKDHQIEVSISIVRDSRQLSDVRIFGTFTNGSGSTLRRVHLSVLVYDRGGAVLREESVYVGENSYPGKTIRIDDMIAVNASSCELREIDYEL